MREYDYMQGPNILPNLQVLPTQHTKNDVDADNKGGQELVDRLYLPES